jgi:hypothetical protein
MIHHWLRIAEADLRLLTITGVGSYTERVVEDGKSLEIGTFDAKVLELWKRELSQANRPFVVL